MRKVSAGVLVVLVVAGGTAVQAQDDEKGWDGWDAWRKRAGAGMGAAWDARGEAGFSDKAVKEAIRKGREFLLGTSRGGNWQGGAGGHMGRFPTGPSTIAIYAILASGVSPLDKKVSQALEWLSKQETNKTYVIALRCNAWYLANKETRGKYLDVFKEDLRKLITSTGKGAYNYECNSDGRSHGDNSNSQYGVLGVWAGALARQEIPEQYWQLVMNHWVGCQTSDGGWEYNTGRGTSATMTAGGVASLFICFDNLFTDKFLRCNVHNEFRPLKTGLEWMDRHYQSALGGRTFMGYGDVFYFLYNVERVGLASGYKYFGTQDWYKQGAMRLIQQQAGDGAWRGKWGTVVATAYALLFLVRGQHPIAFNKLEYEGDWNNRPRDLAGLTRWMSGSFEKTMNWQIINLKVPTEEWHDAPILYLSGSTDPNMTDEHVDKLRRYVWQGGTILSVTECQGRGFSQGVRKLYERMLPDHKLQRLSRAHTLYSIHHRLNGWPGLFVITNGIRPLVIHTDMDLSKSWQLQLRRTAPRAFHVAANTLMYVTDKGRLRPRGMSHWPAEVKTSPTRTIRLARLKHEGNWDPEPLAYERFSRLMAKHGGIKTEVISPVEVEQLVHPEDPNTEATIVTMTGTKKFSLPGEDLTKLKGFLNSGGTLIIDAAGGSRAFAESAEAMVYSMFGRRSLRRIIDHARIYRLPKLAIKHVDYRRKARLDRGLKLEPNLRTVTIRGRFAVIFSKEDLTNGLVGCECHDCAGYRPDSCFELMRNAVIYADDHGRRPKTVASLTAK